MSEEKEPRVCSLSRREFGKSALYCAAGALLKTRPTSAAASAIVPESVGIESPEPGPPTQPAVRKVGGFRCLELASL